MRTTNETLPTPKPEGNAVVEYDWEGDTGFENTQLEEQVTPFLRMAQGLSPELNRARGEFIKGLALGDVFNTATRDFYPGEDGVEMVICWKDYSFGQWIPRDLGSGFRGALQPNDPLVRQTLARMTAKYGSSARFKMPRYKDGRWSDDPPLTHDTNEAVELVETGQFYVLYAPAPLTGLTAQRAVVAFTSTALATYTGCVTRHLNQKWPRRDGPPREAPIYAYKWKLSTFPDKRGTNEFSNWKIDLAAPNFLEALYGKADPALLAAAREFFDQARSGLVKVADPASQPEREPGDDSADADQVPF